MFYDITQFFITQVHITFKRNLQGMTKSKVYCQSHFSFHLGPSTKITPSQSQERFQLTFRKNQLSKLMLRITKKFKYLTLAVAHGFHPVSFFKVKTNLALITDGTKKKHFDVRRHSEVVLNTYILQIHCCCDFII